MSFFVTSQKKRRISTPVVPPTPPVSGDWWLAGGVSASDCLAAYQSIGADSYADSKINLANPGTYDIANGVSYPSWNATTGWTFDGVDDYLDTNLPGIKTATTIIVYFTNFNPSDLSQNYMLSCTDIDWNNETSISFSDYGEPINGFGDYDTLIYNGMLYYIVGGKILAATPYIIAVSPSGIYRNGTKTAWVTSYEESSGTLRNYILGAAWTGAAYDWHGAMDILAVAIYNTTLTDDQISAITTALQAL